MNKKFFYVFILMFTCFLTIIFGKMNVDAAADQTAPIITGVSYNGTYTSPMKNTPVTLDIIETDSLVNRIYIEFNQFSFPGYEDNLSADFSREWQAGASNGLGSGKHTITFNDDFRLDGINTEPGDYRISRIYIYDFAGNRSVYSYPLEKFISLTGDYTLTNEDDPSDVIDVKWDNRFRYGDPNEVQPAIKKISLENKVYAKPSVIPMNITLNKEFNVNSRCDVTFIKPETGEEIFFLVENDNFVNSGNLVKLKLNLTNSMVGYGEYVLKSIRIYYNNWKYTQRWVFDTQDNPYRITLKKSAVDANEAPCVTHLEVLTHEIVKPGAVKVKIAVEDETRVQYIFVSSSPLNSSGAGNPQWEKQTKVAKYSTTFGLGVGPNMPEGEYEIDYVEVMDDKGKCDLYSILGKNGNGEYLESSNGKRIYFTGSPRFMVTSDEKDVTFETNLYNSDMLGRIRSMQEGDLGRILVPNDYEGAVIAPKEVFEAIQGRDVTIVFFTSNYEWRFNGLNITKPKDIDLRIKFSKRDGDEYDVPGKLLYMSFYNSGPLPGKATIRVKSDYTSVLYNLDYTFDLYHVNNQTENLDLENAYGTVGKSDSTHYWCVFEITHNSSFIASKTRITATGIPKPVGTKIKSTKYGCYFRVIKGRKVEVYKPIKKASIKTLNLPDTFSYKGVKYKVAQIRASAFSKCKKLKTVTLGKYITKIGKKAFYSCKKLSTLKVKTTTLASKDIGSSAFKLCYKKMKVYVPKKKYSSYKSLFKKKGVSSKASFKKKY